MAKVARRWAVHGRVQGVGFRMHVYKHATRLGLAGTVRNLEDRSVEVIAVGTKEQLEELEEKLRKGPLFSKVDRLNSQEIAADDDLADSDFQILR